MTAILRLSSLLLLCAIARAQAPPVEVFADPTGREDLQSGSAGTSYSATARAEEMSPATFGMAVMAGPDGRLAVQRVQGGSVSATAGLEPGDVIVAVDGTLISRETEFQEYLAAHPATPIEMAIERHGISRTVVLSAPAPTMRTSRRPDLATEARPAVGLRFFAGDQVIVAETLPGSPAEQAGLQVGDHLVAVNDQVITSSDQFITLVAAANVADPLTVKYVRGAERHTADVAPDAWEAVFGSSQRQLTLKPDSSTDVVASSAVGTMPTYWVTNMSPVGVPWIAYPYYATYPTYAYAPYWYYPYTYPVTYYSPYYGYYPYGYYAWPFGVRWGRPYPGRPNRPAQPDSAMRTPDHYSKGSRAVSARVPGQ